MKHLTVTLTLIDLVSVLLARANVDSFEWTSAELDPSPSVAATSDPNKVVGLDFD